MTLAGKTLFISGGSRGIGLAIALRAARDGANVALIAKSAEPHPALEGTVYTATAQIEAASRERVPVRGRAGRRGRHRLRPVRLPAGHRARSRPVRRPRVT
jgi:NAD(P)-dependent dehydrogenase (short-subunit alcohol dehydrogenase family)